MSVEKLINILAWVSYICGIIGIISIIVAAVFKSDIAAWIAIITFIICIIDFLIVMGLILWDMTNW